MIKVIKQNFGKIYFLSESPKFMKQLASHAYIPASIYLLKVNNKNTRTRCEICSKLTIKTTERRQ